MLNKKEKQTVQYCVNITSTLLRQDFNTIFATDVEGGAFTPESLTFIAWLFDLRKNLIELNGNKL